MIEILLYVAIGLAALAVIMEIVAFRKNATVDLPRLWQTLESLEKTSQATERNLREDFTRHGDAMRAELAQVRAEATAAAQEARTETATALQQIEATFRQGLMQALMTVDANLQKHQQDTVSQLTTLRTDALASAKGQREEIAKVLAGNQEAVVKSLGEAGKQQQAQVEALKTAVDAKLHGLQLEMAKQVADVRATLDAKLAGAEKRLVDSFQAAGERVEQSVARLNAPR
ncbi:MAG: hypothetical protein PCFJNLEI_03237 [Verrucomicrobiae bacterium]|nr:hypothetical protein [Verrucomicrobiae bacterium]